MEDIQRRLDAATKRRNEIESLVKKAEGRLEVARQNLQRLEDECRTKGVEPDQLGQAIQKLEDKAKQLLAQSEAEVQKAETTLEPYLKECDLS